MCIGGSRGGLWGLQPLSPSPLNFKKMFLKNARKQYMANTEEKNRKKVKQSHKLYVCLIFMFIHSYKVNKRKIILKSKIHNHSDHT